MAIVSLGFALYQARSETQGLREDLDQHSADLAETLEKSALPLVAEHSYHELQRIVDRFQNREKVAGVAVYDSKDRAIAVTQDVAGLLKTAPQAVQEAVANGEGGGQYFRAGSTPMHVFVLPLRTDSGVLGSLAVFHDTGYIDARGAATWRRAWASLSVQTLMIILVTLFVLRWGLGQPVQRLAQWLGDVRTGRASPASAPELPEEEVFRPLKREAARLATSISMARAAAEEEARLRYSGESLWTAERLRIVVESKLGASRLFAISNREPYEHVWRANGIECVVPASGLVTALEPILRTCQGTWIAQGTGSADRDTVDRHDRVRVPPDQPDYTLRRVWLTQEEENGFYLGFSNEGLWPLCHIAHTRPVFREKDWEAYYAVNRRFADALIEEAEGERNPAVLVQDYHFALVPRMVKEARPDARVAIFWHIPWPNPEAFGICPWQRELLDGLLGADLIGFHLQAHCNNFIESVDRTLESRIDREQFAVNRRGHITYMRPFPISVTFNGEADADESRGSVHLERASLMRELGVGGSALLGIGVDRVDYTKGLPERLRGLERFFEKYPVYRGQFTFVQIGAPSRTCIPRYQELMDDVRNEVDRINRRFQFNDWRPIVFLPRYHSHREIVPYLRTADLCLVTSLHDGMNLVAKEYVAAQSAEIGVLILSRFAGASNELVDALHVNPYDTEAVAEAIHRALEMAPEERRARMSRMRTYVREHNIYRWAGSLISDLASLRMDERVQVLRRDGSRRESLSDVAAGVK
ncbi:MAG TPA: trehalose-6-phosphate synthase [Bryobacteraceae bacterium]|nr:trehalose-6-phosphate synthase [Bryobacteraceae bacterium]